MILEELNDYCNNCLNDKKISEYENYISCKKHKWACKRFLEDIEKSKTDSFAYYWNEEEAEKIQKWFTYLRHSKGELANTPIILTTWEKFLVCQQYAWRNKTTNYRRFKTFFVEVGRKNAKSQLQAGCALYEISTISVKNNELRECYTAGAKKNQSKIIFNEANLMLRGSPIRSKFKITNSTITHIKTGSFISALSKDDGKTGDGTNPAFLILDEYHQHKTTEFYDLALGGNAKESSTMIITTAGEDLNCPCYTQEYKYASNLLNPDTDLENDEYFADILELDEDDYKNASNIANEELWIKANPIRMSYKEGKKKIRDAYKKAKDIPEQMTAFLTKMLNVWMHVKKSGYMDMDKWRECVVEKIEDRREGFDVYVGLDMSAKIDLTSVAFIIPIQTNEIGINGKEIINYIVFSHSFIPSIEKLQERIAVDKMPYDAWERNGFITVTNSPIVDQNAVINYVIETANKNNWNIVKWCFDPANASKMMMDVSDMGYEVVEVYQSHKSLNESTSNFREEVYCGHIIAENNPVLNYAMKNAIIKTYSGLIKIDKDATSKRIDPVDATLAGFKLAMYHIFNSSIEKYLNEYLEEF